MEAKVMGNQDPSKKFAGLVQLGQGYAEKRNTVVSFIGQRWKRDSEKSGREGEEEEKERDREQKGKKRKKERRKERKEENEEMYLI